MQIARDGNAKVSEIGAGFMTRFRVRTECLARFQLTTVGSAIDRECWIPADELPEPNRHIAGKMEVVAEFRSSQTQ